ncbi:hypothetical protein SLE2022_405890 [Rubroshorea leprosula]
MLMRALVPLLVERRGDDDAQPRAAILLLQRPVEPIDHRSQHPRAEPLARAGAPDAAIRDDQAEARAMLLERDRDRAGIAAIGVFLRVDDEFDEDQPHLHGGIGGQQDGREIEREATGPFGAHRGLEVVGQLVEVAREVHRLDIVVGVEAAVDERHRGQPPLRLAERSAERFVLAVARLHRQEGDDELEAVLDAVVHLLQQRVLLREQPVLVRHRDTEIARQIAHAAVLTRLEQDAGEAVRGLHLGRGPSARATAHLLGPRLEGLARRQRLSGREIAALVRVARPLDELAMLAAEPQQHGGDVRGERDGEEPARALAILARRREHRAELARMEGAAVRRLHPARHLAHVVAIGARAREVDRIAVHDREAVGIEHPSEIAAGVIEHRLRIDVAVDPREDRVLVRAHADALAIAFRLVLRADLAREAGGDEPRRAALGEAEVAGAHVVAGDETPQHAVLDDRDGGGRRHPHVAQILEVDGRDRAKLDIGQVDRRALGGADRRRLVADVGNHADAVADIERTRLLRDVGGGEVVVVVGREPRGDVLGDDDARFVVEEAVDHHPVVAGELVEGLGGALAEFDEAARALEAAGDLVDPADHVGGVAERLARLELDEPGALAAPRDRVEPRVGHRAEQHLVAPGVGEADRAGDEIGKRAAQPVRTEARLDIAGARHDAEVARVRDEQQPVRLDRAGKVDRFAIARIGHRGRCPSRCPRRPLRHSRSRRADSEMPCRIVPRRARGVSTALKTPALRPVQNPRGGQRAGDALLEEGAQVAHRGGVVHLLLGAELRALRRPARRRHVERGAGIPAF